MKKTTFLLQMNNLRFLNAIAMLIFSGFYSQAQVGTLCTNPIVIASIPYTTTDNTANYADNYDPPTATPIACGAGTAGNYYLSGNDVVYSFTPTGSGTITLQIPSAPAWTGFFVFTSCANIGVTVYGCSCSSASGNRTISNLAVTAGQTYYIVISSWASPQTIAYTMNITGTLDNEDFASTAFTTYPNPVRDVLQIENPEQNISSVAVYNLLGQQVLSEDWSTKSNSSLDMSKMVAGTYLLSVTIDGKVQTKKIIKL